MNNTKGLTLLQNTEQNSKSKFIDKKLTARYEKLIYLDDMHDSTCDNGDLTQIYYYSDNLHLVERGNEKFAKFLTSKLSALPPPTATTSISTSQSLELPSSTVTYTSINQLPSTKPLSHIPKLTNIVSFHCPANSSLYDNFFPTITKAKASAKASVLGPAKALAKFSAIAEAKDKPKAGTSASAKA